MVAALNADCALLNSGTLRSDARHPAGKFLLRVSMSLFFNVAPEPGLHLTLLLCAAMLGILPANSCSGLA
jgi:hypothetical protein